MDEIGDALEYLGMDRHGERVMYSGATGERLKGRIFMGMTYVQKLKHMVGDKIRARGRGRMQPQIRQPAEGRVQNGGLKMGEMERDCLLSHGASANVRDRMCLSSDGCPIHVCRICHVQILEHQTSDTVYCKACNRSDTALRVPTTYGFKLFAQELSTMGLSVKMHVVPEANTSFAADQPAMKRRRL